MKGPTLNQVAPADILPPGVKPAEERAADPVVLVGQESDAQVEAEPRTDVPKSAPKIFFPRKTAILVVLAIISLVGEWSFDGSWSDDLTHYMKVNAVLVMLSALALISIIFELGFHHLHHVTAENFHPVLKAMSSELMTLGYIAIIFYVIEVKMQTLSKWSINTVCEKCDPCQGFGLNQDSAYHLSNRRMAVAALVGVECNLDFCTQAQNQYMNKAYNSSKFKYPFNYDVTTDLAKNIEYAKGDEAKETACDRFHTVSRHLLEEWDTEHPGWLSKHGGLPSLLNMDITDGHSTETSTAYYRLLMELPVEDRMSAMHTASLASGLHGDTKEVYKHMLGMLASEGFEQQPQSFIPEWARGAWAEHRRLGGKTTGGCYHCDQLLKHLFEDVHMSVFMTMILYFIRSAILIQQVQKQQNIWRSTEATLQFAESKSAGAPGSAVEHEIAQEYYSLMQGTWELPEEVARKEFSNFLEGMKHKLDVLGGEIVEGTQNMNLLDGGKKAEAPVQADSEFIPLFKTGIARSKPSALRWLNPFFVNKVWRAREALEYTLLRRRFLSTHGDKSTLKHFDFAEYLSIVLGSTTAGIVHIPPRAWVMIQVCFVFTYLIMLSDTEHRMRAYVLAMAVLLAAILIVCAKMYTVRDALLPTIPAWWGKPAVKKGEAAGMPCAYTVGTDFWSLVGHSANKPAYMCGGNNDAATAQAKLFWGGMLPEWVLGSRDPGPTMLMYIARLCNLLGMIWLVLLIYALPYAIKNDTDFVPMLVATLVIVCLVMWTFTPEILRVLTIVSSVEMMKRPGVIDKTVRQMKTKRTLNVVCLLRAMGVVVRQKANKKAGNSPAKAGEHPSKRPGRRKSSVQAIEDGMSHDEQDALFAKEYVAFSIDERKRCDQLQEFFEMFDQSGDGSIDVKELAGLLRALGVADVEADMQFLMTEFDKSGDGAVSFPEFYSYMKSRVDMDSEDTYAIVDDIFSMIDKNGDGTITLDEFTEVLMGLPIDMTQDDIIGIVQEMDSSGDGEISVQEFAEMLDQHKASD